MTTTTNPGAHVLDVVYLCDQDGLEHDSYHQRDADGAFLCAQCGAELTEPIAREVKRDRGNSWGYSYEED